MEKLGLVLEGGGIRGAYTAGALEWLKDNNVKFDYYVGISSGAAYLSFFLEDRVDVAHKMATYYTCQKDVVGLKALLRCGHYVDYQKVFEEDMRKKEGMNVDKIINENLPMEVGCYDLAQGKTIYFNAEQLDKDMQIIRGACALPIASAVVDVNGYRLLDGGITKMIPIERAVEQGCTKCLVITTKPKDYVRKPSSKIICWLMKLMYRDCPQIAEDYKVRHLNYYKQRKIIDDMCEKKDAINIYPSKTLKVSRWKGDPQTCEELYQLGYSDMEKQKEQILALLKK